MRASSTFLPTLALVILIDGCARKQPEPEAAVESGVAPESKEIKVEGKKNSPSAKSDSVVQKKAPPSIKKSNGTFMVGKETTFVTGPLDKDGFIDYPVAFNAQLSQSVTPENNANVLIMRALGPRPLGHAMTPGYYEAMGISSPPEDGTYFVDRKRFQADHSAEDFEPQIATATRLPWTTQQCPHVANWLKVNEHPLALFGEASLRTHYYHPMLPTEQDGWPSGLLGALLPGPQQCREVAVALTARAMWWIGQGNPEKAWQDILTIHRLARLIGRGRTLIESLVAFSIDGSACRASVVLLDRGRLGSTQLERCLRDIQQLSPLPDCVESLDLGERFNLLDILMNVCRYGLEHTRRMGGPGEEAQRPISEAILAGINCDPACNSTVSSQPPLVPEVWQEFTRMMPIEPRLFVATQPAGRSLLDGRLTVVAQLLRQQTGHDVSQP